MGESIRPDAVAYAGCFNVHNHRSIFISASNHDTHSSPANQLHTMALTLSVAWLIFEFMFHVPFFAYPSGHSVHHVHFSSSSHSFMVMFSHSHSSSWSCSSIRILRLRPRPAPSVQPPRASVPTPRAPSGRRSAHHAGAASRAASAASTMATSSEQER